MQTEQEIEQINKELIEFRQIQQLFPNNSEVNKTIIKLELILSNHNVERRRIQSIDDFTNYVITKEHLHREHFTRFLTSDSKYFLIYGPTQLGKTDAALTFVKKAMQSNILTIVSTDNKTDQLEQFYNRFNKGLTRDHCSTLLKVSDSQFDKKFERYIKRSTNFVIFMLDNFSQINKIFKTLQKYSKFLSQKIAFVHDEGDVIIKHNNVDSIVDEQSKSHKSWKNGFDSLSNFDIKRVFITATPEAVVSLYQVERILEIEKTQTYIGYDNIHFKEIQDTEEDVKRVVTGEITRRFLSQENGIILVCTEKKISSGQDPIFESYCNDFPSVLISTYNGQNGITARPVFAFLQDFDMKANAFVDIYNEDKNNKTIKLEINNGIYNFQGMAIRDFYQICKDTNHSIVITIGMDLMSRGISFVSTKKDHDALAATTMILSVGKNMHNVGLCQMIGRICGTARPELQRRLLATESVICNYIAFNENQKQYLKALRESNGIVSKIIMDQIVLNNKLTRPIDRPALKLKFEYLEEIEEDEIEIVEERMQELIRNWWNKDTIIGKILKFIYDSEIGVSEQELKEFLREIHANYTWYTDLHQPNKDFFIVFTRSSNRITNLKPESRTYINSL